MVERGDVERTKPEPELFLACVAQLGVSSEGYVVGDTVWDLLAARRTRMLSIGLLSGGYGEDELTRARRVLRLPRHKRSCGTRWTSSACSRRDAFRPPGYLAVAGDLISARHRRCERDGRSCLSTRREGLPGRHSCGRRPDPRDWRREFVVIVGPSGSGKTTALRMAAGLEEISEGTIAIGDRIVNNVPARDRNIAMVFQSYALYPHLSVEENIAFGLKVKKLARRVIKCRVEQAADLLELQDLLDRKPRDQQLALDASVLQKRPRLPAYEDAPVIVGIRPESIQDAALVPDAAPDHMLHGSVELREALGPELFIHFTAPDVQPADTESIADLPRDTSAVGTDAEAGAVLVGRFSAHSGVRAGGAVDAVVDTGELHFFDPDTGRGIYGTDDKRT